MKRSGIVAASAWLVFACGPAPSPGPAHGGAAARDTSAVSPASVKKPAKPAPLGGACASDEGCLPLGEPCRVAVCEAERCVAQSAPPRTVCELSDDVAVRQAKLSSTLAGDPGVCSEGACVPRVRCMETCGAATGEAIAQPFSLEIQRCYAENPGQEGHEECRAQTWKRMQSSKELFAWLKRCAYDCGLPEVATPE